MTGGRELCGHLIAGDPGRPCVMKAGHLGRGSKARHEDAEQAERRRQQERTPEYNRRRRERYNSDPMVQANRLETDRLWRRSVQGEGALRLMVRKHKTTATATVYGIPLEYADDAANLLWYVSRAISDYHSEQR